jgi:hypothetical protein
MDTQKVLAAFSRSSTTANVRGPRFQQRAISSSLASAVIKAACRLCGACNRVPVELATIDRFIQLQSFEPLLTPSQ